MRTICNKLDIPNDIEFDISSAFNFKFFDNENKIQIEYLEQNRFETI